MANRNETAIRSPDGSLSLFFSEQTAAVDEANKQEQASEESTCSVKDELTIVQDPHEYHGLLFIGDPHLEGRIPGFRKDNYPLVILEKVRWCIRYAATNRLLPVFLGDLFHVPRDNPNWMIVELLEAFAQPVLGIYGNHDVRENRLNENDSLSILVQSGRFVLLSPRKIYKAVINGRVVFLGGSSWGEKLPDRVEHFELGQGGESLAFWITHHDIRIEGSYDAGNIEPHEIQGLDAVINGHIHRKLETVACGETSWMTPGNISRRKRDDATREHIPSVLRIDVQKSYWEAEHVEVQHAGFEEVFHETIKQQVESVFESDFVAGLAQLENLKTESGQGLHDFLEQNVTQFDADVASEIKILAREVTENGD